MCNESPQIPRLGFQSLRLVLEKSPKNRSAEAKNLVFWTLTYWTGQTANSKTPPKVMPQGFGDGPGLGLQCLRLVLEKSPKNRPAEAKNLVFWPLTYWTGQTANSKIPPKVMPQGFGDGPGLGFQCSRLVLEKNPKNR